MLLEDPYAPPVRRWNRSVRGITRITGVPLQVKCWKGGQYSSNRRNENCNSSRSVSQTPTLPTQTISDPLRKSLRNSCHHPSRPVQSQLPSPNSLPPRLSLLRINSRLPYRFSPCRTPLHPPTHQQYRRNRRWRIKNRYRLRRRTLPSFDSLF